MKSKTQIERQLGKKTNPVLVQTIIEAKKKPKWVRVAAILSSPRLNKVEINLNRLNKEKKGEIIVVPGKVLSEGEVDKELKIVAFNFSSKAREKLLKAKCDISDIMDEIKKNPDAKGIKILTNTEK